MELKGSSREIEKQGIEETVKMSISMDKDNEDHIIKVLTENYKYPVQSTIREVFSNHWDANLENDKLDNPIPVKLYRNQMGNYTFETSDSGKGLSEEGFYKYYMGIGQSTKRGDNRYLGAYGAGCKSPLSYTDSYEVISRHEGKEYKFLVFKGEERPECTKVYEKDTELESGITVKVPVDRYDFSEFSNAIKSQLCYFPTAHIQIEGDSFDYNNAKIFETEHFIWSEIYPSTEMHISFGNCHYDIAWDILKIAKINVPVGIKIPIDSFVKPHWNRETLAYSKETKEYILGKIKEIANFFVNRYNNKWKEYESFIEAVPSIFNTYHYVKIADVDFCIDSLEKYADSSINQLKIKGIDIESPKFYHNLRGNMLAEYHKAAYYDYGVFKTKRIGYNSILWHLEQKHVIVEVNSVPVGYERKYLIEKYGNKILFIKKFTNRKLGDRKKWKAEDYIYLLSLNNHKKETWRDRIKEFQRVENEYKALIKDETNVQIPEEWLSKEKELRKANKDKPKQYNSKALNKEKGQVTLAWAKQSYAKKVTFDKAVHNISDLKNRHFLTIYGTSDQKEFLSKVFNIVPSKVHVVIANKSEIKHLKERHNFISIEKFIMGDNKTFRKIATAILFDQECDRYWEIYRAKNELVRNCIKEFHKNYETLKKYCNNNRKNSGDMKDEILQIATEFNLFDQTLWSEYQNLKKCNKEYTFISCLKEPNSWNTEEQINYKKTINQLLLFRKKYDTENFDVTVTVTPKVELVEEEAGF